LVHQHLLHSFFAVFWEKVFPNKEVEIQVAAQIKYDKE